MSAIVMTFDTHSFYTRLKSVGFSEQQAEVIAEIQKETASAAIEQTRHDYHLDDVATKCDLATKRDLKELELKIELVRADLQRDIEKSKSDLMRLGFLQIGLIVALLLKVVGMI